MYFLDTVFPLQYPMYNPGIQQGGRGWLLALLLKTKPLYHAALALAAYHRQTVSVILANTSLQSRGAATIQQERHLEISLKLLGKSTETCGTSDGCNGMGISLSVFQLAFYEVIAPINLQILH